ncbi:MAG TPA: pyrimidine dimer DNA glycosylase/endonuclease V [Deltaproteobacteria bacterium]|nr:pyrimidine dimer DNA glycosylase/endonuclease V [Deltaproteobacteria bacterium]
MRLWTIAPCYLDPRGLTALWREGLLALAVLQGRTRGYRRHPQLVRFQACPDPVAAIAAYLREVYAEALRRGYRYDAAKLPEMRSVDSIEETDGQLAYEWGHLKRKLAVRSPRLYDRLRDIAQPAPHPLFRIVPGDVRDWEKT